MGSHNATALEAEAALALSLWPRVRLRLNNHAQAAAAARAHLECRACDLLAGPAFQAREVHHDLSAP
jgi:hypothetical protein